MIILSLLILKGTHSRTLHTFANPNFIFIGNTRRSHNSMSDNAFEEKVGDFLSKDVNRQMSETSSKIDKSAANDTRLCKMILVCLNCRIRKVLESPTAGIIRSNNEVIFKYNLILSRLLQSGEINIDTKFSELIKILENTSIMKRMLGCGHMLAKYVFEDFLSRQYTERAKRHKHNENSSIDAKCFRKVAKEHEGDEKEEGEV